MITIDKFNTGGLKIRFSDVTEVAVCIRNTVPFARDKTNRLYYYHEGVYKPSGEELIAYLYMLLCEQENAVSSWRDSYIKKIQIFIQSKAEYILDRPYEDRINFRNGLYFLGEYGRFESHEQYDHSDYRTTIQIPINYDALATCEYWDKFLTDVFPEDIGLLYDIVGLCMVPFTGLQKCIVLLGGGSNGKGTFLTAIQKAIGTENYANLDLKRLVGKEDRFSTANLVGKLVNVFGDLPPTKIENTALFKALTGQDTITVEYKGKQSFSYQPFARLIFSCNEILETSDNTIGYKRRFFCIPFDAQFAVDPRKKAEIEEQLASPDELSGLVNKILPRLPVLMTEGLQYNAAAAAKVDNYVPIPDWFKIWFKRFIVIDEKGRVPSEEMYVHYASTITMYKPDDVWVQRSVLINFLKAMVPGLICNRTARVKTKMVKCYYGVRLINVSSEIMNQEIEDIEEIVEE